MNKYVCDYCKIRKAKYTLKNGKHCCEKYWQRCPKYILKQKNIMKEVMNRPESKERIRLLRTGVKDTKETRYKKHLALLGNTRKKGKKESKQTKKLKSKSHTYSIKDYKILHPFFSQIEEMRYNPDKPGEKEIQVHCKNHNCPNSKEQGGWFTPNRRQIEQRLRALEHPDGNDGCYIYCSQKCKNKCILYGIKSDPYKEEQEQSYTQSEYQQFRQYVLERDNYKCQYCGEEAEHVHHERPQKLEPFFALDPDLAWSVCKECHYKYGHKDDCSTGNLASKKC
jgi:5-methylcytosine-specific restriction endonuclease McrA